MAEPIINKVAESGLLTLDLEQYYPKEEVVSFDLQPFLFMGMILKEKEYRAALQQYNWAPFEKKIVAVHCSSDAIIPVWAYMLAVTYLQPIASDVLLGTREEALRNVIIKNISSVDVTAYAGHRVVVKGCGEKPIGEYAYLEITKLLMPVAKSIMYGEPCSTVPVFKRK
jgi:hypothetical protein